VQYLNKTDRTVLTVVQKTYNFYTNQTSEQFSKRLASRSLQ